MAKVTEYPRITKMKDNDILLVDGPDGTRTILQSDASKQMGGEVIMVNETAGDSTKVVINTTDEDIELATMADLEPVEEDVSELKTQLNVFGEPIVPDFTIQFDKESGTQTSYTDVVLTANRRYTIVPYVTSGILYSMQVIDGNNSDTISLINIGNAVTETISLTGYVRMTASSVPIVSTVYIFDTTGNDDLKDFLESNGSAVIGTFVPSDSFEDVVELIVSNMSGEDIPINPTVNSEIGRIKEISGIGNVGGVSLTTTGATYTDAPGQPTNIDIAGKQGDTIKIKVSGDSLTGSTSVTAYLHYTDDTTDTKNNITQNVFNSYTLAKNLSYVGFYITNITTGKTLTIAIETIPDEGMLVDIKNNTDNIKRLQAEKAETGISVLTSSDYTLSDGRIKSTDGTVVDGSSFKHVSIDVSKYELIEFTTAPEGLGTNYGCAFYDANGDFLSGRGFGTSEQNVKVTVSVPANAKTWMYGFYNPYWEDSKYSTFTFYDTDMTIYGVQNQINEITGKSAQVVCFGDSLTQGNQDSTGKTYPLYLSTLIGKSAVNAGVGGENSLQIASRQGGIHLMVEPFTIPATATAVSVTLSCLEHDYGDNFGVIMQAVGNINPVEIAGVVGTLTYTGNWSTPTYTYTFTRNTPGDAVEITRPMPVVSNTSKMRDYIQIIWAGTNDSPYTLDTVKNDIVPRIDAMIEWMSTKNFLVIGLTAKTRFSDLVDCNTYMQKHFGTRFIDISRYILQYGLSDESITPTSQDTTDIANGEIPSSLRADTIHLNQYGYDIVANQVYKRGQLLGYWE